MSTSKNKTKKTSHLVEIPLVSSCGVSPISNCVANGGVWAALGLCLDRNPSFVSSSVVPQLILPQRAREFYNSCLCARLQYLDVFFAHDLLSMHVMIISLQLCVRGKVRHALEQKRRQGEMRRVRRLDQRAEDRELGRVSMGFVEQALAESSAGLGVRVADSADVERRNGLCRPFCKTSSVFVHLHCASLCFFLSLQNPALALTEAFWRVEVWDDAGSSTAGGSSS